MRYFPAKVKDDFLFPSRTHHAVFPQISHNLCTIPQKSPENPRISGTNRDDTGHIPNCSKSVCEQSHVGSNPTVSAKRLSVVIITADFFLCFLAVLTDNVFTLFPAFALCRIIFSTFLYFSGEKRCLPIPRPPSIASADVSLEA